MLVSLVVVVSLPPCVAGGSGGQHCGSPLHSRVATASRDSARADFHSWRGRAAVKKCDVSPHYIPRRQPPRGIWLWHHFLEPLDLFALGPTVLGAVNLAVCSDVPPLAA